jgi:hypothetical protein
MATSHFPQSGVATPKLNDELNCKSKYEINGKRKNWGTLLSSEHFGGRKACGGSEMGTRKIDKQVNYSHRLAQAKQ